MFNKTLLTDALTRNCQAALTFFHVFCILNVRVKYIACIYRDKPQTNQNQIKRQDKINKKLNKDNFVWTSIAFVLFRNCNLGPLEVTYNRSPN